MWWHHPWWNIGAGMMILFMLLFWGLVILGGYLLIRALVRQSTGPAPNTPRAILDRRLAAGEITPEEYDALRGKLEG